MKLSSYYRTAFRNRCFNLIIQAYLTALNEKFVQLDWNENDITSELCQKMQENPARLSWGIITNVESHIPTNLPKIKGFADRFSRIDIRMASIRNNYEYEYFFEAKNLKQNDSKLKRRYIDTGIDSFVTRKYENGSLIGYLLEGEVNKTIDGINKLLVKDKRNSECLQNVPNEKLSTLYESNHSKPKVLKHIIFDFC